MSRHRSKKEIRDAIDLFESAYYVVPTYDAETGTTSYTTKECPVFTNVRNIKGQYKDYQPGEVKIYTTEEIKEYEDD